LIAALIVVGLLAADSNSPQDLLKLGLLALQQGKITEARADFEQASRADPKNAYVWAALAQTYLKANEPKLGAAAAETAEKIGSGDPVVSHALAMYYSEVGQLAHAAKLDSQIAFYWTKEFLDRGDFTQAADVAQSGVAGHPKDAQLVLALGVARYGQRRFDDAVVAFLKVIQLDPQIEQPYVFLGKMLDQAGPHLEEITKAYEAWAASNAQNAEAQLLLAKALLAANSRDERAESLLRRSIAINATDWEAHYELGVLLENRHDYATAARELQRAIELDAKQPMPHYHLARVYDRLGEPERANAERAAHERLTVAVPAQ
jgi:Flp pilus assembly protein TadD